MIIFQEQRTNFKKTKPLSDSHKFKNVFSVLKKVIGNISLV